MVTAEFGSDFLSVETTKDGDIAEITGEGAYDKIPDKFKGGMKEVLNLPVKLNGKKDVIYTPTPKYGKAFIKAWGAETKEWVGKKLQILHIDDKMVVRPM